MKQVRLLSFLLVLSCFGNLNGQEILFGSNNYIEYQEGTLPIVISVPHGGTLEPITIPDRDCNNPTTVRDANTIELARQIDTAFYQNTGCHPHIIFCHLRRTKLDCNRNLEEGACFDPVAETAWLEYHAFIDTAQAIANKLFNNKVFYIDLHGHGHPDQRLELGYLLDKYELELSDEELNSPFYVNESSIQNLVDDNALHLKHTQLLKGEYSLGTLIGLEGYPAVPSAQIPSPGTNSTFFSGGYSTRIHSSFTEGITVNGVQIECNFTGVRDSPANRKSFGKALSDVLINYLQIHEEIDISNCNITLTNDIKKNEISIFPNPILPGEKLQISGNIELPLNYALFNTQLLKVSSGLITDHIIESSGKIPPGLYFLKIFNQNSSHTEKLVIGF